MRHVLAKHDQVGSIPITYSADAQHRGAELAANELRVRSSLTRVSKQERRFVMRCFFCSSPAAHPANGSELAPNVLACERCTREFWAWFRSHMRRWSRKGEPDFYLAAAKFSDTLPPMDPRPRVF